MSHVVLPERTVLTLIQRGVDAIRADLDTSAPGETVLDDILRTLSDAERAKARDYYRDHPPTVIMGYPRIDAEFPLYALTLTSDSEANRYIGTGEHDEPSGFGADIPGIMGAKERVEFNQWTQAVFTVFVYAEHPDLCAWYYRVLRRIMNVGIRFLIGEGLDNPVISGAELAPDPRYTPDNLFVRRLTLTVEYDEEWSDRDALWLAINGEPEKFITDPSQLDVRHVDSRDPLDGGPSGGIVPINLSIDLNP
jgi:hypothetical protein